MVLVALLGIAGLMIFGALERAMHTGADCQKTEVARAATGQRGECAGATAIPAAAPITALASLPKGGPSCDSLSRCTGGSSNCFVAGTLVWTTHGPVPIEAIAPGDEVVARDADTGEEAARRVIATKHSPSRPVVRVVVRDSAGHAEEIVATAEHPFFVPERGWVPAGSLDVGDRALAHSGARAEVVSLESMAVTADVFNLEVATTHAYLVGEAGVVVHNDCLTAARLEAFKRAAATHPASMQGLRDAQSMHDNDFLERLARAVEQREKSPSFDESAQQQFLRNQLAAYQERQAVWRNDTAARRADINRIHAEMRDVILEIEGKYYQNRTRGEWIADQGSKPTAMEALRREAQSGEPTRVNGVEYLHAEKVAQRMKQLDGLAEEMSRLQRNMDEKAMGPEWKADLDKMVRRNDAIREDMTQALDDWNTRAEKFPTRWNSDGTSKRAPKVATTAPKPKPAAAPKVVTPEKKPAAFADAAKPKTTTSRPDAPDVVGGMQRAPRRMPSPEPIGFRALNVAKQVGVMGDLVQSSMNRVQLVGIMVETLAEADRKQRERDIRRLLWLNMEARDVALEAWMKSDAAGPLVQSIANAEDRDTRLAWYGDRLMLHYVEYDRLLHLLTLREGMIPARAKAAEEELRALAIETAKRHIENRFMTESGWKEPWAMVQAKPVSLWGRDAVYLASFHILARTMPDGTRRAYEMPKSTAPEAAKLKDLGELGAYQRALPMPSGWRWNGGHWEWEPWTRADVPLMRPVDLGFPYVDLGVAQPPGRAADLADQYEQNRADLEDRLERKARLRAPFPDRR